MRSAKYAPLIWLGISLFVILPAGAADKAKSSGNAGWIGKGQALFQQGKLVQARQAITRAIMENDKDPKAWTFLGIIYGRAGWHKSAYQAYSVALLLTKEKGTLAGISFQARAHHALRLGMWEQASSDLNKAVELRPDNKKLKEQVAKTAKIRQKKGLGPKASSLGLGRDAIVHAFMTNKDSQELAYMAVLTLSCQKKYVTCRDKCPQPKAMGYKECIIPCRKAGYVCTQPSAKKAEGKKNK